MDDYADLRDKLAALFLAAYPAVNCWYTSKALRST